MSEPNYRLRTLFQRYVSNTCTRQELEELMAALGKEPIDEELRIALEQHWLNSQSTTGIPDADAKLDRLFESTRTDKPVTGIPLRRKHYWWRYAAAAVLVCGLTAAGYLFLRQSGPEPAPITAHKRPGMTKDIAPGGNKATLILANGDALVLDSASGKVLQQGNTAIQLGNGSLQYAVQGKGAAVSYNILSTPRGGQYHVVLPDGTHVWLNAMSRLRYPTAFTGKERMVELEGQGYFEIAKNEAQPFKVQVSGMEVQALGTSFDIMAYTDEKAVNTTLLEGAVKVNMSAESRLLQPGQQASVAHGASRINIAKVNTDHVIAWKNGYFSFSDADIQTVMRQLSRWYDVEISYQNGIPQDLFSGEIGKGLTLAQALNILERAGVHSRMESERHIVILPAQP